MLERYTSMPPLELRKAPNLISLLYGWEQAAGNEDAKNWARANTQSDEDLLIFLARARGWSSGNYGVRYPLNRRDIGHFLDYDAVRQRIRNISEDTHANAHQRQLAAELLDAFVHGDRD